MKGVVTAWMASWGVIAWSDLRYQHRAPIPAEMLMPSILFIGLGLVAEVGRLEKAAGTAAWGLVLMAFLTRQGHYSGYGSGIFGGGPTQLDSAPQGQPYGGQGQLQQRGGQGRHIPPGK